MLKYNYDFKSEVPAPKNSLDRINEIINKHSSRIDKEEVPRPDIEDETELLVTLFGLGRLVEVNVRIAWEIFALNEKIKDPAYRKYNDVLKCIEKHFQPESLHALFRLAMIITDGIVHGDFRQAFEMAKRAYDRDDLELTQEKFIFQTIVTTKFTKDGLHIDARTGKATTSAGDPIEHTSYVPSKENTIQKNFYSFYISAGFVSVYDVLSKAFERAFHFRKCIENAKSAA
jgi:hypothetical protein